MVSLDITWLMFNEYLSDQQVSNGLGFEFDRQVIDEIHAVIAPGQFPQPSPNPSFHRGIGESFGSTKRCRVFFVEMRFFPRQSGSADRLVVSQ